jgi:phage gp29-like protein
MVREDIERADAKAIATVINRQIVRPFVDLNYGPQEVYPKIKVGRADEKDAALIIDAVEMLVPLGFRVGQGQVRTILGISEPDPEDEVFSNAASPAPGELGSRQPGGGPAPALQALLKGTQPAQIASRLAIALAAQQQQQDAIDRAAAQMLGDWEEVVSEPMRQIVAVAHASSSLIDFKERLAKLYPSIDMSALTDTLATATFQAFAAGYVGDGV